VPQAPTIGTATTSGAEASITFTPGATGGATATYTATSNPGGLTGTSSSSPITVSNLVDGETYTFTVTATNSNGTSLASAASNSITVALDSGSIIPLQAFTLSSVQSSIEFNNIPQTYKHLQIRFVGRVSNADTADNVFIRFNGDSGSNYSWHYLEGDGTTTASSGGVNQNRILCGRVAAANATANIFGAGIIDILDYNNTNKSTTTRSFTGIDRNGSGNNRIDSGNWRNNNAITSIQLINGSSTNFVVDSSFVLYGVEA